MNQKLQQLLDAIQQSTQLGDDEKNALLKNINTIDKEIEITLFKLDRTEKVKKTTAILLEETIEELEQKRKAVEAQNKELEIESSLERVRTVAMGMQKPEDLLNIAKVLYKELLALGFTELRNALIQTFEENKDYFLDYDYADFTGGCISRIPFIGHNAIEKFIREIKESKDAFSELIVTGKELEEWKAFRKANGEADDTRLDNITSLYYYNYSIGPGSIGISTYNSIAQEKRELLKRFRNVFDFAYRRYMDVAKAETQAKEAQIELALERVRARTMAMHHSNELAETSSILFQQIKELGFETWSCGFCIWAKNDMAELWMGAESGGLLPPMIIPYKEEQTHNDIYNAFLQKQSVHHKIWEGDDLEKHYEFLQTIPSVKTAIEQLRAAGLSLPKKQCYYVGFFKQGYLLLITKQPNAGLEELSKRFASVFDLTYTRFLDLQKAEAQSREAQVEVAVERVRAQSMAMHQTTDLQKVNKELYDQLQFLNVEGLSGVSIYFIDEDGEIKVWDLSSPGNMGNPSNTTFRFNAKKYPILGELWQHFKKDQDYFTLDYPLEILKAAIPEFREINPFIANAVEEAINSGSLTHQWNAFGKVPDGVLGVDLMVPPSDDTKSIVTKMAGAFNLAYKRFLDLQKAEAQAREAQIETALERVRSRTLAMQKSEELAETAAVLFQQLIALGIEPNRLYISIVKSDLGDTEFWITDEDGSKVSTAFAANMNENITFLKMYEGWQQHQKSLVIDMQGDELQAYFHYLTSLGVPFKDGLEQKRRVQDIAYFSKGFIGMASPEEQPVETLVLLERFAAVFNLTFTRFSDLKVAEAHAIQAEEDLIKLQTEKKRAEDALSELRATQTQLIQSEKMASLGELTAGIAHEIQNPLNFVNNFSEVSNELIDEMNAEIEKGDMEEAKAIANDIKQNLEKINHHGKRADAIVKGMLQHSRSSSATKEPTDINKLADEYLRLAYHGLRAKDKSFNATLKTDYDENIGNINIIPQDIGRVILNLITNAFYAVDEKKKAFAEKSSFKNLTSLYEPTVSVSTKRIHHKVQIKVTDNGNGIPQNIIDKIFQPFFTTKPTGQGTGLGLSLAYDIVKAHGGELKVENIEGKETEFIIVIPIVNA